ncbi:MAG TPA: hypothetical protein VE244_08870 [Nitrososphaeraceae archaeon]|jgi:hypothetical protein|nr:hypothetical protein [Nitrososphaeraceae archaeon]
MFIIILLDSHYSYYNNSSDYIAYGHLTGSITSGSTSSSNKIQEWIHQREGIKIQFTYKPDRPIVDTFTELKFSVLNITSGDHIKDFLARVVVTNGQRLFKFENITVADGDFSVKYLFPDDGTHQVVTGIDMKDSINLLSSFNVFVPHQQPPTLLNPFPSSSDSSSPPSPPPSSPETSVSPPSSENNDNNNQKIIATALVIGLFSGIAVVTIVLVRKK